MDKALKQRLTGAIILIALAIIFLPMLLDGEQQNSSESRLDLPEKPVVNFPTRRIAIGQHETRTENNSASDTAKIVDLQIPHPSMDKASENEKTVDIGEGMVITPLNTDRAESVVTAPASEPVELVADHGDDSSEEEVIADESIARAPAEKVNTELVGTGQWQLQIASFAGQSNAEKLVSRLRRTGYQANIEALHTEKTTLYRVLVPGYPDRSAASLAAGSISKQITGVNPRVVPPPSTKDDPKIPAKSASTSRWVVQLGIFSQATNADKLVAELTLQSYSASRVKSGSVHKVLVGPLLSRELAIRQRDEIFKKIKIKGLVKETQ